MLHMERRSFVLGGLAALVALSTPKIVDRGVEMVARAEAKENPVYDDIGKYYDDGTPSDVMPGARQCSRATVRDNVFAYQGSEWFDHYFDNPQYSSALQQIFRNLDGQRIEINSPEHQGEIIIFDFEKFHEFNRTHRKNAKTVGLWYDGFMDFGDKNTFESTAIPIPLIVVTSIEKLYK